MDQSTNKSNNPSQRSSRPQNAKRPAQGRPAKPAQSSGGAAARPTGRTGRPAAAGAKRPSSRLTRERTRAGQQVAPPLPNPRAVPINKTVFNGAGGAATGQKRVANQLTKESKLRIIPLGGLGEIGKNMMAIEYENDIIVVDMGFAFPDENQPGIDYIIPDISYLEKHKHKVRGHIITHGHMDHIGGAGYILPKLPAPIYGSRLSLAMVEKQIEEFHLKTSPQFRVLNPDKHEKVQLGVFTVELVRVTHSIPDATAAVITTPVGKIIHTGDWRLDPDPVDGRHMDMPRFNELGKEGVLLLMSDSTRCDAAGRTPSEQVVAPTLVDLFGRAKGRVIVSTFATSVTRVQLIIDAVKANNRKLAFVGRSMLANVELAVKLGYLKVPPGLIVRVQDIVRLKDNEVTVLCTGSQGEVNSALNRMSTGDHPHIKIKPGDSVVYSSSPIPGNEKSVVATVDSLMREGAQVYQRYTAALDNHGELHVSGHASKDDVLDLLNAVKPKYYMPVHGEFHHLVRNAEIAAQSGVPHDNIFIMDNGDVLELTAKSAHKGARVPSGVVLVDGHGVGDVEHVVLRDRLAMASEGIFTIVATVDRKTAKLVTSPDIISRGFIYMKENEDLVKEARQLIRAAFETRNRREPLDWSKFKMNLRDTMADFLYGKTKRNPMVIVVVNEV